MHLRAAALAISLVCGVWAAAPSEVAGLIDMARAAPPEFAADALIRIAASGGIDKAKKAALLEEAFQTAQSAQQPYKRRIALAKTGGPVRFVNSAYAQEIDSLSLRLRAIEALLPIDARK